MFQEGTNAVTFNTAFYLQQNPDVRLAIQNGTFQGTALQHFIDFGADEGRAPNAFFDAEYYLANNTDVLVALGTPGSGIESAFDHFVRFGQFEGEVRAPSAALANFNAETYLAQNPDLQAAFADVPAADLDETLFNHFLNFGINENRPGTGVDVDGGVPGQTIAFTAGVDALVGTANNDTFTGVVTGAAATTTFQAGDSANGGAGTDRLNLTVLDDSATIAGTSLTNIEQVFVRNLDTGTATLNAADWTGVQQLWNDRSGASDVAFTNVQNNATLGLNGTTAGSSLAATFSAGLGTTAALNVASANSTGTITATTTGTDIFTSLNVLAGAGKSALTVAATAGDADIKSITVSGEGAITLIADATADFNDVTTVNASANTGGLTIDLSANTKDLTVTGGSGNDVFVLGENFNKADTIDGGAGRDTVSLAGADFATGSDALAAINAIKNVEILDFTGATGVTISGATFTNTTVDTLSFNTVGNDIVNQSGARVYAFGGANDGTAQFNAGAGVTTLNLAYNGTATNGAQTDSVDFNLNAANPTSVATVNITAVGTLALTDADANATGGLSLVAGSTVNVSGAGNLNLGAITADGGSATAGFTINASTATGNLIVAGSDRADVITLGTGTNFVTGSTGADRITLNTGVDTITYTAANQSGNAVGGIIAEFDVITGFQAGTGGDVLRFDGTAGAADFVPLTAAQLTAINGATSLTEAANAAANINATSNWTAFNFGGNAYAIYEADADDTGGFEASTDILVQLSGVDAANLTVANFDVI